MLVPWQKREKDFVSDLSTNVFISCLRRFVSRIRKPNQIYCDKETMSGPGFNYVEFNTCNPRESVRNRNKKHKVQHERVLENSISTRCELTWKLSSNLDR